MTFHVMSSRAYVRGGRGRACPLSFTDFSQPSLNERGRGKFNYKLPQYGLHGSVGPRCGHYSNIERKHEKGGREEMNELNPNHLAK